MLTVNCGIALPAKRLKCLQNKVSCIFNPTLLVLTPAIIIFVNGIL